MRYIGVDLHKTNFVVCFLNEDDSSNLETFPLSKMGIERFTSQLKKDDALAVEVTQNIYYFYDQIKAFVERIVLVDTYRFSVIAKSKKKTDKADALALARFLKLDHLPEVPVPSERVRQLRHLLQARETLVGLRTKLKNLGHAALTRNGIALVRSAFASASARERLLKRDDLSAADRVILQSAIRQIAELDQEIEKLEAEIVRLGKTLKGIKRLLGLHGMNLLSAISLLAEIGSIELFETSKQLVAYSGLATSVRQSNETIRQGHITKQGRKRLQTVAIRAVLSMVNRTNTPLMSFYQKKKREKGSGKAICATARKLLTIIFVMLKKELDYWYLEERLYNRKLRLLNAV
ncbi:MAG: IS110 family transposase [Acidobacteria bacterium]|nr:IS110 family transposase [Acidobacteriota bacterium]MCA1637864.1 IS110 family transposase [Acidobacteriota bacterium]